MSYAERTTEYYTDESPKTRSIYLSDILKQLAQTLCSAIIERSKECGENHAQMRQDRRLDGTPRAYRADHADNHHYRK